MPTPKDLHQSHPHHYVLMLVMICHGGDTCLPSPPLYWFFSISTHPAIRSLTYYLTHSLTHASNVTNHARYTTTRRTTLKHPTPRADTTFATTFSNMIFQYTRILVATRSPIKRYQEIRVAQLVSVRCYIFLLQEISNSSKIQSKCSYRNTVVDADIASNA